MKWSSCISNLPDARLAVEDILSEIRSDFAAADVSQSPDFLFITISAYFHGKETAVFQRFKEAMPTTMIIGTMADGVAGNGIEIEAGPAMVASAAFLPGVELHPFYLQLDELPDADSGPGPWHDWLRIPPANDQAFLLLVDPFHGQIDALLEGLDFAYPNTAKFGGLVSGASVQGGNFLYLDGNVFHQGVVGMSMQGLHVDMVVAQGCRDISPPMAISHCTRNHLEKIDGRPAMEVLTQLLNHLSEADRARAKKSLFIGITLDDPDPLRDGGVLVRNLVGVDYQSGAIVIGADLHEGQQIRFMIRDREAASQDLEFVLEDRAGPKPLGAMLFSCLGRGEFLFKTPNHDSGCIEKVLDVKATGFFCNGEIGPVGSSSQIHGYTSVIALFAPLEDV